MVEIINSKCVEGTSVKELSTTIEVSVGDFILATITTRSDTTIHNISINEGWNVIYTSKGFVDTGTYQFMSFAYIKADTTNISIKINQQVADRIYINLIAIRGITTIKLRKDFEIFKTTTTSSEQIVVLDKKENEKLIWGCSAISWNSTVPYKSWITFPNDLTIIGLDQNKVQPRQANFIDLGNRQINRYFNAPVEGTVLCICAIELVEYVYEERYIIRNGSKFYIVVENTLSELVDYVNTSDYILENGMLKLPNSPCILTLNDPHILYWRSDEIKPNIRIDYTAVPKSQVIIQNYDVDFSDESIDSIKNIVINTAGNGLLKLAISMDSGESWYAYNNNYWTVIDISDKESFKLRGISKEIIETIANEQWISFTKERDSHKYRVAILCEIENITDNLSLEKITINYKNT